MVMILLFSNFYIVFRESEFEENLQNDRREKILVVLGAAVWSDNKPSPILAARVNKASEITKNFSINKLYFTGGSAPGELTEAEVALNYFQQLNPEFVKIEIETSTKSTNEQIQFIKNQVIALHPNSEIVVISDSFHLVRIKEISNFHKIDIKTIASDLTMNFSANLYNRLRESLALSVFWLFSI
jgi:vancomycin permeability regulator SanA